jgi:hypothetical protein
MLIRRILLSGQMTRKPPGFLKPMYPLWMALVCTAALGQSGPGPAVSSANASSGAGDGQAAPVSYASVRELNTMLGQLESISKGTQVDLAKLRIDRWHTDNSAKRQTLTNVDSIQRNLSSALPEIMGQLRSAPEDVPASFRLYRNLDALYDVLGNVVESVGAFGSKDDFQALANDLNSFEGTRKQLAERINNLSTAKEAEIARLRTDLKTAQAAIAAAPAPPPKKIIIDDTQPPAKKSAAKKKKPAAKSGNENSSQQPPAKPQSGQSSSPQ